MFKNQAFSLVELSIVLVILGLLTGGILTGQSLIRASELRSVSADFQRYQAAVNTFRDKYFALPGDMRNATSFWGVQNATPATCQTTASSTALTCDGTGDGQICCGYEIFRAWQHLANAGLIEGTYSGIDGGAGAGYDPVIGGNVPRGKISNTGWSFWHSSGGADANWFTLKALGNMLAFGTDNNYLTQGAALKAEEAWNIDTKMDDGKPAYGKIIAMKGTTSVIPNCATTAVETTAEYNVTNSTISCHLNMGL